MFEPRYGRIIVKTNYTKNQDIDQFKVIYNSDEYDDYVTNNDVNGGIVEVIGCNHKDFGRFQVKPYFDIDDKSSDGNFDLTIIDNIISDIKKIVGDVPVWVLERSKRKMACGLYKRSFHLYVDKVRISHCYILSYFKELFDKYNCLDKQPYKSGQTFHSLNSKYKANEGKVTPLVVRGLKFPNFGDTFATWIMEDFKDLDTLVPDEIKNNQEAKHDVRCHDIKIKKDDMEEVEEDDCEDENPSVDKIKGIIDHLKPFRADKYDDWLSGCFAMIGCCKKYGINRRSCEDFIHQFSAIFPDKYDEGKVCDWIADNYKRQMEREGNQYGLGLLLRWLKEDDPEYYNEICPITYDKVKKEFGKLVFKIADNSIFIELNTKRDIHKPDTFYIMNKSLLMHKYCDDQKYQYVKMVPNKKGEVKQTKISIVSPSSEWWDDITKVKYDRLVFQPFKLEGDMANRYYNIFQGFNVQHMPVCKDYSKITNILRHIKDVMANGDEDVYHWLLIWLSRIMKGNRTEVFVMFRGIPGNGKSIILEQLICKRLIGETYSVSGACPEKQFFGNFNSLLENRVLTVINEGKSELRNCIDVIKDVVTNDRVTIEKKGYDAVSTKNYNNFAGTTNNLNIINIDVNCRRFAWFPTSSKFVGNTVYFRELADDIANDECVSAFYHYLLEVVDDNGENLQTTRPKTELYKQLQYMNLPSPIVYMCSIINDKEFINYRKYKGEEYTTVKCKDLYNSYKLWANEHKYEPYTYLQFETKLLDVENFGITKCADRKGFKVFKIVKQPFEDKVNVYTNLEGLEVIDDDYIDDE